MKKGIFLGVFVALFSQVSSQPIQFTGHLIYQASSRLFFVTASDLDKDGDQDILFTQPEHSVLQWFENLGEGNFIVRDIGAFSQAFSVFVVDFDYDGDNDLLASSYTPSKVVLFENDGGQNFSFQQLSEAIPHPLTIAAEDVDKDGDYDIACATQDANKGMMLLRNDGNLIFTPLTLSSNPFSSTWTMITDFDQDGDWDILGNDFNPGGGVLWYEQNSQLVFTEHLIPFAGTHGFTAADIDDDGDMDLAAVSCGSQLAWFRNEGNNNFTCLPVENNFACAVSVAAADLDLDLETDLVASAWSSDKIAWWQNNGDEEFSMQLISDSLSRPNCVFVADLNNDSLPDIVSGGYSGTLIWWENLGHGVGTREINTVDGSEIKFCRETNCLNITLCDSISMASVTLINTRGAQLFPAITFSKSISLSCDTIHPGIYLVNMQYEDHTITRKIMINP